MHETSVFASYVCVESSGHDLDEQYMILSILSLLIHAKTSPIEVSVPYVGVGVHQQTKNVESNTRQIILI